MKNLDRKTMFVVAVICVGAAIVGTAGFAYLSRHAIGDDIHTAQSKLESLQRQLELTKRADAEREVEQPSKRWQLTEGPEVVPTMQTVQSLADEFAVHVDELQAKRSAEVGRQTFSLAGHGDPTAVCAFLASIEQDDRLMIVETGRFLPAGDGHVAFELGLATYYGGGK